LPAAVFLKPMARPLQVGDRVQVAQLVATVRFLGSSQFAAGDWLGLELDNPVGKNDGSIHTIRYFTCPPNHGIFARPTMVTFLEAKLEPKNPDKAVTILISAQDGPESPLTVLATSMNGNELASCRLSPKQSLADLRNVLAEDLGNPAVMLQFVSPTGQLLDESRNAQPLSEIFSEIFRQD